jgi:hypothetical protein
MVETLSLPPGTRLRVLEVAHIHSLRRPVDSNGHERPAGVSPVAIRIPPVRKGRGMTITGLRQRLENLEGVAAIQLELAETGLSGIRVTLADGADESIVLERIRSMLITYGLRSPGPVTTMEPQPETDRIHTSIMPEGDGMRVEVSAEGKTVVRLVDASPLAAARAVAEARAALNGQPAPEILWIGLDAVGNYKILTVLARAGDQARVGAAVVNSGWAEALDEAVAKAEV